MKVPANALIVVADGESALLLRNIGGARHLDLRVEKAIAADESLRHDRDGASDRPGRWAAPGSRRGGPDAASPKRRAEAAHLAELATHLNECATATPTEAVVLMLDPAALGVLRARLSPQAQASVIAEVVGAFRHETVEQLEARLARE